MFFWEIYEFFRRSHRRCFMKKAFLKNFAVFTGKLEACNFIKNRLQHRCLPLNNAKFLRRTSASGCFWFFKTTTEPRWAAASVLTHFLSSDNLLTGYEQLRALFHETRVNGIIFESVLSFQGCSQWNCHVKGTPFQSGLRFQIGLSSLRVSCTHALSY